MQATSQPETATKHQTPLGSFEVMPVEFEGGGGMMMILGDSALVPGEHFIGGGGMTIGDALTPKEAKEAEEMFARNAERARLEEEYHAKPRTAEEQRIYEHNEKLRARELAEDVEEQRLRMFDLELQARDEAEDAEDRGFLFAAARAVENAQVEGAQAEGAHADPRAPGNAEEQRVAGWEAWAKDNKRMAEEGSD